MLQSNNQPNPLCPLAYPPESTHLSALPTAAMDAAQVSDLQTRLTAAMHALNHGAHPFARLATNQWILGLQYSLQAWALATSLLTSPDPAPLADLLFFDAQMLRRKISLPVCRSSMRCSSTRHQDVDIVIIRENTDGKYSGLEHEVMPGVIESLKVWPILCWLEDHHPALIDV